MKALPECWKWRYWPTTLPPSNSLSCRSKVFSDAPPAQRVSSE